MPPIFQVQAAIIEVSGIASGAVLLFALLIGHAICDFALQGEFLSLAKNRHANLAQFFGDKEVPRGLWFHALGAHSLIHAAPVWWITGSVGLAALEVVLHGLIDFAKCEGWTRFSTDQFLHVACKVTYVVVIGLNCPLATWHP
ncbi:DUF3307 domain-containing protein [Haloferula rosea]|uniref:DUF3307 domain-containing protein n=1 Tax=Haloferula rosea TaxID=490093 RepID=A0A934VF72_9BACT|nr:DUF3307 domain-containing protein [Haloferula rosea]MBK1826250.1 DUF3307 domain-containing protein [Haloferula rosea]